MNILKTGVLLVALTMILLYAGQAIGGQQGGDVDARQFDGDLVSGFNHLFRQVIPEKFTGKAEKPCDLLRAFKK